MYYTVVNVPFFIVRLIIWHLHDKHISVFLVKNVLGVGLAVQHLHEILLQVGDVIKADVHSDDAAASGKPGGTAEMRQLTMGGEAGKATKAESFELTEIRS